MNRTVGVVFLILGIVGVVGGLAVAGYSYMNDLENQDQSVRDEERSASNAILGSTGLACAGIGLVLLIVGIVLNVVGPGGRQRSTV